MPKPRKMRLSYMTFIVGKNTDAQNQRVYADARPGDGARFLVECLWPRGMKKEDLKMKAWLKEVASSSRLRKWYGHDPDKWEEFQRRYRMELESNPESWKPLLEEARRGNVTLLYSAWDVEHNSALLLKSFLDEQTGKE